MAKKTSKKEETLNLEAILFKCRDILRQGKNSGSFFEKRDMMLTLVFLRFMGEKCLDYGCMYTIKKYQSEKLVTKEGWQHTKVELIPLNKDYDVIELSTDKEFKTIGVLKCVL